VNTDSCRRVTLPLLLEMKQRGERIAMVTVYDAPSARLADEAGLDLLLVGDSAAMVVLGHDSTLPVTLEEMIILTRAVSRVAIRPLVVGDLPFGSYQVSDEEAVTNAIRLVKDGGADIVKLEGSDYRLSRVRAIIEAGIPVMGHIGLTPQSATMLGGYRAQGRTAASAQRLYDAGRALEAAGCCALVLEAMPSVVAERITRAVGIPTIGIGAGPSCDGQVLVWHDLLGLTPDPAPRFVERYAQLGTEIRSALERYVRDVRDGTFPDERHSYGMPDAERAAFEK
jgi:3-methyl-2-oxobutanoate hydroxymethyltransferase